MPTNADILSFAPGAAYLAAKDVRKGTLFNNFSRLNERLPQQIYSLYFVLNRIYTEDSEYSGLTPCCQYLWEIMGKYGVMSQGLAGGGGSVAPVTPNLAPDYYDFEVSASSFIATGESSKVLPSGWGGFDVQFIRNHIPQSIVNEGGTYFSWNKITRTLTLIGGAAAEGEIFQIFPV